MILSYSDVCISLYFDMTLLYHSKGCSGIQGRLSFPLFNLWSVWLLCVTRCSDLLDWSVSEYALCLEVRENVVLFR